MLEWFNTTLVVPVRDFIYPPLCFVCDKRLENGDVRVCSGCWSAFTLFKVGDDVWHELKNRFAQEGAIGDFLSCFYFERESALQQVVHLLKYQGIKSMGVRLGRAIGERIAGDSRFASADFLIPIPLHKLKQRERGFNQSEFICQGIGAVTKMRVEPNLIRRVKYTQSQTELSLEERRRNVGDAFEVNPRCSGTIKGRTVILVDDVITTGATVNACARELVRAGARSVLAVSAAVAP